MGNVVCSNFKSCIIIMIEGAVADVTVIVLEDRYVRHDLIIGRDYLCNENVLLIKTKNELTLRSLPPLNVNNVEIEESNVPDFALSVLNFGGEMFEKQQRASVP